MDESKDTELEELNVSDSVVTVNSVATETVIEKVVSTSEVDEVRERVEVSEEVAVDESKNKELDEVETVVSSSAVTAEPVIEKVVSGSEVEEGKERVGVSEGVGVDERKDKELDEVKTVVSSSTTGEAVIETVVSGNKVEEGKECVGVSEGVGVVVGVDESKDKEFDEVKTIVSSSTSGEAVIEKVVSGSEVEDIPECVGVLEEVGVDESKDKELDEGKALVSSSSTAGESVIERVVSGSEVEKIQERVGVLEEVAVGESKDKELDEVKTVGSSSTAGESVIEKFVSGSEVEKITECVGVLEKAVVEEYGGGSEVGDVMVEVLGSEVFVDGVMGVSGEVGGHELGCQDADVGVVNFDGGGGIGVHESIEMREDGSGVCREGNVTDQLENQSVGCNSNLAYSGSWDSEACDIGNEKIVGVVDKDDIEMELGDLSGLENVELCRNTSSHTVEGKCSDVDNSVLADEKMVIDEEEGFETVNTEDKGVNTDSVVLDTGSREEDHQYEGAEHIVSEAAAHVCTTVIDDEMVNGGITSAEASVMAEKRTCQEKADILDSVSRDSENSNSKLLYLHTQTSKIEFIDGASKDILVPEPDKKSNGKIIEEDLPFVSVEESNDVAVTTTVGHGDLDESKLDGTYMEIDAASGSRIHSENHHVDMHERGEDIENNVILASFSKVSGEEFLTVEMDIDAADVNPENKTFVYEAVYDKLKSNSENQESEAGILANCNSGDVVADDNTKLFDPKASSTTENHNTGSPLLDAEAPYISVETDLPSDSRQDGKSTTESVPYASYSDIVEDVIRDPESVPGASYLDNHASDGDAEIGSNMKDLLEVQEAMHDEQVSVGHALSNEGDDAKLPKPVTFDADSASLSVSHAEVVLEVRDKQSILSNASTDEEKAIKLSDPVIGSMDEDGSNLEADQKVEEEAAVSDQAVSIDKSTVNEKTAKMTDYVTSAADVLTHNNSIVEDVDTEGVIDVTNATPIEQTTMQPNSVLPATVDILDNIIDENFIVETEGPGEWVARSPCVDVESGPTHDENGRSDAHVHEPSHSPFHSPVRGLEQEAADHDAKAESDMEDAQGDQEAADYDAKADSDMEDAVDDQEAASNDEQSEEQDVDEEYVSGSEEPQNKVEKNFSAYPQAASLSKDHRISYQLPHEIDREFSVADLVWGKVKSHPWWPGQIFHPSDSSEKAMKYFKKDCYLVAYFGDRTFAWNEASVLKPFRNHFSVAERQIKNEAFQNAVSCALAEVSRRMELGLACSCVSQEAYDKIRYQMVENTGIKDESSQRDGVDRCTGLDYFQPDRLSQYVRSLAIFPTGSVDRLELVTAKAQLLAFHRLKGVDSLADFQYYEGISGDEHENAASGADSKTTLKISKRKHNLKDVVYQRRKEKSMTELIGETMYYLDSEFDSHEEDENMWTSPTAMKRKASGHGDFTSQQTTKTISVAKVSHTPSANPQQSFKVGECIRRVASQLTGSASNLKGNSVDGHIEHATDGADEVLEAPDSSPIETSPSPSEQSSLDEMLSQLHLFAQDPMKGYTFLDNIVSFFVEFRNAAVVTQRQRLRKRSAGKRKSSATTVGNPGTFEFEDRNDSYWKDMVVQNNAEAKPARRGRKRKDEQGPSLDSEKPSQSKPRKSSRKQYFHGPLGSTLESPLGDEKRQNLPTELMLSFSDAGSLPSEMNLNKMFRCFGPLKESETEIDKQSSRARLVFKKRTDAEVAYSSAAMFNIFGSTLVNYQLNYTPSVSLKTSPLALTDNHEKAT